MGDAPRMEEFGSLNSISISRLSPSLNHLDQKYLYATVILLWPYSSTTKQFSLLLSEPDFRLRGANGQVKVNFRGKAAEAVANAKVGSGDTVYLTLDGAELKAQDDGASNTVQGIEWELLFCSRVLLEVIIMLCVSTMLRSCHANIMYRRCTGNRSCSAALTSNEHLWEPPNVQRRRVHRWN